MPHRLAVELSVCCLCESCVLCCVVFVLRTHRILSIRARRQYFVTDWWLILMPFMHHTTPLAYIYSIVLWTRAHVYRWKTPPPVKLILIRSGVRPDDKWWLLLFWHNFRLMRRIRNKRQLKESWKRRANPFAKNKKKSLMEIDSFDFILSIYFKKNTWGMDAGAKWMALHWLQYNTTNYT